jgi:hydrogenase maturation protease
MRDDGLGPYCVHQLMAHYDFPPDVEVADLGTPGLDLALHLSGADRVLIIDALRGDQPGTIAAYDVTAGGPGRLGARLEPHSPALDESILIARLSGASSARRPLDRAGRRTLRPRDDDEPGGASAHLRAHRRGARRAVAVGRPLEPPIARRSVHSVVGINRDAIGHGLALGIV